MMVEYRNHVMLLATSRLMAEKYKNGASPKTSDAEPDWLDQYGKFGRPRKLTVQKSEGQSYGFNFEDSKDHKQKIFAKVVPGGPADLAGVQEYDIPVLINGKNAMEMAYEDCLEAIRLHHLFIELVVIDPEAFELYDRLNIAISGELAEELAKTAPEAKAETESIGEPPIYEEVPGGTLIEEKQKYENKPEVKPNVKIESEPEPATFAAVQESEIHENIEEEKTQIITRRANGQYDKPRKIEIISGDDGLGFYLECDCGFHIMNQIAENGPADLAGILHNDRIYEVGRVNVTNKTHAEVVDLIKASEAQTGKIELLVVDEELDEYYRKNAIKVTSALIEEEIISEKPDVSSEAPKARLIKFTKKNNSFGMEVHTKDDKYGMSKYLKNLSSGGPAKLAGCKEGDKIIAVNGVDMKDKTHDEMSDIIRNSRKISILLADQWCCDYYHEKAIEMTSESLAEVTIEGADLDPETETKQEYIEIPEPDYEDEVDGIPVPIPEEEISEPEAKQEIETRVPEPEVVPEIPVRARPETPKSPTPEPDYDYASEPEPLPEPEPEPKVPPPVFAKPPLRQSSLPVRTASPPSVDKLFGEVKNFGGIAGLRKNSGSLPPPAPKGFQGVPKSSTDQIENKLSREVSTARGAGVRALLQRFQSGHAMTGSTNATAVVSAEPVNRAPVQPQQSYLNQPVHQTPVTQQVVNQPQFSYQQQAQSGPVSRWQSATAQVGHMTQTVQAFQPVQPVSQVIQQPIIASQPQIVQQPVQVHPQYVTHAPQPVQVLNQSAPPQPVSQVIQPQQPVQQIQQQQQHILPQPVQYIQQAPVQYVQSQPEPVYQTVFVQPQPVQMAQPQIIQRQQSLPTQPQQYQAQFSPVDYNMPQRSSTFATVQPPVLIR